VFHDDFARPNSASPGDGWLVVRGALGVVDQQLASTGVAMGVVPELSGSSQTVSASFRPGTNNTSPRFGVVLRYQDPGNYYAVYRRTGGSSHLRIVKVVAGVETVLATKSIENPDPDKSFTLRGEASGTTLRLALNGAVVLAAADAAFPSGAVGIELGSASGTGHRADNFSAEVD
jgi:hypothetical protein